MPAEEVVRVLVVHDGWTKDRWEQMFERDAEEHADGLRPRRMTIIATPCQTRAAAERDIDYLVADPDSRPHLVLIDHLLQKTGGVRDDVAGSGPQVMHHLSAAYRRHAEQSGETVSPPRCLLATSRFDNQLAYAFRAFGGHNVLDRNVRDSRQELLQAMWNTYNGVTWTPPSPSRALQLDEREISFLPLLELGLQNQQANEEYERRHGHLPTPSWDGSAYSRAVGEIASKMVAARDELYPRQPLERPSDPAEQDRYDRVREARKRWQYLDAHHRPTLAQFAEHLGYLWIKDEHQPR